jgi:uncharacterized protein (TIGR00730 family)
MRVCVFCGSSPGRRPEYAAGAAEVGRLLASRSHGIVFGGGDRGLMGSLARAALSAGGEVIGVIPEELLKREMTESIASELRVVPGMHARKMLMYDLATAYLILPGGLGTLDEVFETLTWGQLGFHQKPVALLNLAGYFDPLLELLDQAIAEGFVEERQRSLLRVCREPMELVGALGL